MHNDRLRKEIFHEKWVLWNKCHFANQNRLWFLANRLQEISLFRNLRFTLSEFSFRYHTQRKIVKFLLYWILAYERVESLRF